MRAAIAKRFSGDAALRRRRKLCFWTACFCNPSVFAVTAPLPKKSLLCKSFSGARNSPLFRISVGFSYETCAWLGARARQRAGDGVASAAPSALPRSFKTSTRLALTPVYLPHIDRINIDVKFFRNNAFHDLDMMVLKQGRIIVKNNKIV